MAYLAQGNKVLFAHFSGETRLVATTGNDASAQKATDLLNKADYLNNVKRQYTASSRLHAEVEQMPGINFVGV